MIPPTLPPCAAVLAASVPLVLLGWGLLPDSMLNRHGARAARTAARTAALACVLAAGAAALLMASKHPGPLVLKLAGPLPLGVYFDRLAAVMLTLITFLLAVITRFSVQYRAGDPRHGTFVKWLALTGGAACGIVVSGNLVQLALAWCATSLFLHRLLVFYPERTAALLAARKKFMVSRLGDACLLAAILLARRGYHSVDFGVLLAAAGQRVAGAQAICWLLVVCGMLKSAQLPFHSWLPDTMETPTPVSALMHAGIINAGGFLIIRMSPLLVANPAALSLLAVVGALTALFASLVMLTHASVKRALAFSTVAQMGFMMLECGLGAFSLAVLHLVAHSLYKAHAFLASGSLVRLRKAAWNPELKPGSHVIALGAALAAAVGLTWLSARLCGVAWNQSGLPVLGGALVMAVAYALWNLWGQSARPGMVALGLVFAAGITAINFGLHRILDGLLDGAVPGQPALDPWAGPAVTAVLCLLFLIMLVVQTELPQWADSPVFRMMYVHARNGFYFNTLANRAISAVWPVPAKPHESHNSNHE